MQKNAQQLQQVWRIALPNRLNRCFDYLPLTGAVAQPGARVRVNFAGRQLVGVLVAVVAESEVPLAKLKPALELLDVEPLLPEDLLALAQWAHRYYHYALGEILGLMLPKLLRQGQQLALESETCYRLTSQRHLDEADLNKLAKKSLVQAQLLQWLGECEAGVSQAAMRVAGFQARTLAALEKKAWIESCAAPVAAAITPDAIKPSPITLNTQQQQAVDAVLAADGFEVFLLDGVTGSGKTEVYLRVMAELLAAGKQVLVLVPEIGLTPQTLSRFQQRFAVPMVVMHSALTDHERAQAWLQARAGQAALVVGTRSALFTPLPNLGAIIIDEEHDASFRQQTHFRYSARDLALVLAKSRDVPVVLGSATPSLHSRQHAQSGRYQWLSLTERAGDAVMPRAELLDVRGQKMFEGISAQLQTAIGQHLAAGNQVLLFLNRRGYAPVLLCHQCGWSADCRQCDAKLTLHRQPAQLVCHHCDWVRRVPAQCEQCENGELLQVGLGTERVEETLLNLFPDVPVVRVDRDSIKGKDQLLAVLARVQMGEPQILLGTQMLAKGHHFSKVTLVGIIDADQSLYSGDFRASEQLAQTILQVAGRAGRAQDPGTVLIQTHHPQHPLLLELLRGGYGAFAKRALAERQATGLPPFAYIATLRAESPQVLQPERFLRLLKQALPSDPEVELAGPMPMPIARKAGRYRAQLVVHSQARKTLHQALSALVHYCETSPDARKVRWSLEVDG